MTQAGYQLMGLCYSEGCLYVVERLMKESGRYSVSLTVYTVQSDSGHITRLDTLTLPGGQWRWSLRPRVDRHSRRVFVPCEKSGVIVAHLNGDKLVRERTLTCVSDAVSVDVMPPDTLYVGDWSSDSSKVHVVDVRDDRIMSTLETPDTARDEVPWNMAVLGDNVMVGYGDLALVVYRHGSPAPVRVIPHPEGLSEVSVVSTDCRSNYIVADRETRSVFIIDNNGELRHTVNIPDTDNRLWDCVLVNRQLWVGCLNGDCAIMSSQWQHG